jgi:hypothetical protein
VSLRAIVSPSGKPSLPDRQNENSAIDCIRSGRLQDELLCSPAAFRLARDGNVTSWSRRAPDSQIRLVPAALIEKTDFRNRNNQLLCSAKSPI